MKNPLSVFFAILAVSLTAGMASCAKKEAADSAGAYTVETAAVAAVLEKYNGCSDELNNTDLSELIDYFEGFLDEMEKTYRDCRKANMTDDVEFERKAKRQLNKVAEKYEYIDEVKECLDSYTYAMDTQNMQAYEGILDRIENMQ